MKRKRRIPRWVIAPAGLLLATVVLLLILGPGKVHKDSPGIEDAPDTWPQMSFFKREWTGLAAGQRGVWPVEDVRGFKKELTKLLKEGEWQLGGVCGTPEVDWRALLPGVLRWVSGGKQWRLYVGHDSLALTVDGAYGWYGSAMKKTDSPERLYDVDRARMEALLALTEWGQPVLSLEPETDLCFAGLPWGCNVEEAQAALPGAVQDGLTLTVTDAAVCSFRADVTLTFEEDEQGTFLNTLALTFTEEPEAMTLQRFDRAALCGELSKVWGERHNMLPQPRDSTVTVIDDWGNPERLWYWYTEDFSDELQWMSGVTAWFERTGDPRVLYIDASGRNLAAGRQFDVERNALTVQEIRNLHDLLEERLPGGCVFSNGGEGRVTLRVAELSDLEWLKELLRCWPWVEVGRRVVIAGLEDTAPDPSPLPRYPVEEGWELLSEAELEQWIAETDTFIEDEAGNPVYNTMSCCFTSRYTDPTELDLFEFLHYYDFREKASEEEFRALKAEGLITVNPWWHEEDFPVPLHRVPAAQVEAETQKYFGIGLSSLKTDYRQCCMYLPEYDCFYLMTSDWGPGTFKPMWGEKQGDRLRLWNGYTCLSLHRQDERWLIDSFLSEGVEPNTGANALLSRTVTHPEGRTLSREADYVFIPADAEYRSEPRGETAGVFPAGTRLFLQSEYLFSDGELWLKVSEETWNAPAKSGWLQPSDVEVWTASSAQQDALRTPVWLPAQIIYYPANFGERASDSAEDCITPENARTHSYDLTGSILALEGDYARVSLGQLEVWVLRDSLITGIPLQHTVEPELLYLSYGRESAERENPGHPLAEWGAELVWHRGRVQGEEHYTAYYPTADGSGTVAAVFFPEYLFQPQRIVLIPPDAEDWP